MARLAFVLGVFGFALAGCEVPPPCPHVRASTAADATDGVSPVPPRASGAAAAGGATNLDGARELDRQGVRAYAAGRYSDAVLLFRESFGLGGPASELWNIARSEERQDHAESAAHAIEAYLAQSGLTADDRAGAARELAALRARPSLVTVTSTPAGASVIVDGQATVPSLTPVSFVVSAGPHTLALKLDARAAQTVRIDARFGRAVALDVAFEAAR